MFRRERECCRRKIIKHGNKSHRESHCSSKVPIVETFKPIAVFVPLNGPQRVFEKGTVQVESTKFTPDGHRQTGTIHTLVAKYPIFDTFTTSHGGGRTGGGGTSEKSISKAKAKLRNSSNLEMPKRPKRRRSTPKLKQKKWEDDYDY